MILLGCNHVYNEAEVVNDEQRIQKVLHECVALFITSLSMYFKFIDFMMLYFYEIILIDLSTYTQYIENKCLGNLKQTKKNYIRRRKK